MTLPIVYFSYSKDAFLLEQSLLGVARLRERHPDVSIPVYVFDDASSPLEKVPDGVVYEQTTFNRNGNLNGLDCVKGMADCYIKVAEAENADFVVKCDCDTYINSIDTLLRLDPLACAQAGMYNSCHFISGHVYAVSKEAASYMRAMLDRPDVPVRISKTLPGMNEDITVFRILHTMPGKAQMDIGTLKASFVSDGLPYDTETDALMDCAAVTFKPVTVRLKRKGGNTDEAHADAEVMMKDYTDAVAKADEEEKAAAELAADHEPESLAVSELKMPSLHTVSEAEIDEMARKLLEKKHEDGDGTISTPGTSA